MQRARRAANPISISVAPAIRVLQKPYYDLPGTIEFMRLLWQEAVVDGFEFQNLAEWDDEEPPRDERANRFVAWSESRKYTIAEIAALLSETGLPILSVHANRDVGICLCSGREEEINRGKRLIQESLSPAEQVGAPVCVFHFWDTWKEAFDHRLLQSILREIETYYPRVKASVENIPTHLADFTPFELVKPFKWITLDLQWAVLYDELGKFEAAKEQITNVHLRGRLQEGEWVLDDAPFTFNEALDTIRSRWGYSGLLTMEPSGVRDSDWDSLVLAMATLRAC